MSLVPVVSLCLLVSLGASAPVRTASLDLIWKGENPPPQSLKAQLVATPVVEDKTDLRERTELPVTTLERVEVQLPRGVWWIRLLGRHLWARPQQVFIGEETPPISLEVWPAGMATGRIVVSRGESTPKELLVKFTPAPLPLKERLMRAQEGRREGPAEPAGVQRCPITDDVFQCELPAATLDLRLRPEGFVAQYRWGLEIGADSEVKLGTLKLVRGASLVGWVVTYDGSPLTKEARVELQHAGLASPLPSERDSRNRLAVAEASVNDRGFFHFDGVKPGEYQLTALQDPFGPAIRTVAVIADREAELREPLVLAPPEQLSILVEPPVDPDGLPWHLVVVAKDYYRGRAENIVDEEVPVDGWWEREGLSRGTYGVALTRSSGDSWVNQDIELGEELMPVRLEVTAVRVEGSVRLGGEPLAAAIWFGSRFGTQKVELRSSEEGEFDGLLPRSGTWFVEVEAESPRIHRKLRNVEVEQPPAGDAAEVVIELPNTVVRVEVVDEDGGAQPRCLVYANPLQDHVVTAVEAPTDAQGKTEIRGLAPGLHYIYASARGAQTDGSVVMVSEDLELSPITLILRKKKNVQGRVLSPIGPVPGARVILRPVQLRVASTRAVLTDANGEFEYQLPPDTQQVRFSVYPPGFAYRTGFLDLPRDKYLEIEVSQTSGALDLGAPDFELLCDYYPTLLHNGVATGWAALWQMASSRARHEGLNVLNVARMEPGHYAFCWWKAMGGGDPATTPRENCVEGQLLPLGTLALELPSYPRDGCGQAGEAENATDGAG